MASLKADKETQLQCNHDLSVELRTLAGEKEELETEVNTLKSKLKDVEFSAGSV